MQCTVCSAEVSGGQLCPRCNMVLSGRPVLPAGTRIGNGWFELRQLIGIGSSGLIYEACEANTGNPVAIKEILPLGCSRQGTQVVGGSADRALKESTMHAVNEANVLSLFDHPGLLKIHASFEENGTVYTVMELLRGHTLQELSGKGIALDALLSYVAQTCDALERLHGEGVIHGDIKPDNLFVTDQGKAVLLDFGTAIYYRSGRTHTREYTAGYAAPEQIGRTRYSEGPHTDIYSLCATLYHLMSGELPGSDKKARKKQKFKTLSQIRSDISEQFSTAINSGLELEADRRPSSIEIFGAMLGLSAEPWEPPKLEKGWQKETRLRPIRSVDASADGRVFSAAAQSGTAVFCPMDGSQEPIRLRFGGALAGLAVNGRADRFVVGSETGSVKVFNAKAEALATLAEPGRVGSVAFSSNDQFLAAGLFDGRVLLWNARGEQIMDCQAHTSLVRALVFSPDARLLVSGSHDGSASVFSVEKADKIETLPHPEQVVYALDFSPDSQLVATSDSHGKVYLWAVNQGIKVRTLRLADKPIRGLAFSPDGEMVLAAGEAGNIEVFSVRAGRRVARGDNDQKLIGGRWSAAGMVTVSEVGRIRGWSLAPG